MGVPNIKTATSVNEKRTKLSRGWWRFAVVVDFFFVVVVVELASA